MDRLSIILTMMTGAMLTGGLVVIFFSLGYYGWTPVVLSVLAGMLGAWPSAWVVSRRIKRQDPNWDETRVDRVTSPIPKSDAPEV